MFRLPWFLGVLLCASLVLTAPASVVAKGTGLDSVKPAKPAWTMRFESPVEWQWVTSLGELVVSTGAGLYGIDSSSGGMKWGHADLIALSFDRTKEIPGSPLVMFAGVGAEPRVVVIDSIEGTRVFDSRAAGIATVLDTFVLPANDLLLVVGLRTGEMKTTLMGFDVETGDKLWVNEELVAAGGGALVSALAALVQVATEDSGVRSDPLEHGESFLMVSGTGLYKFDARTGETQWRVGFEHDAGRSLLFSAPGRDDVVYVGSEQTTRASDGSVGSVSTYYSAFRLEDGGSLWDSPAKVKGPLNQPVLVDQGIIASPGSGTKGAIKLLDYASGRSSWGKNGKGLKGQGGIVSHAFSDAGLVITTGFDSAWDNAGVEYFLNILDVESGTLRFPKPFKVKGRILHTEVLPKGVLYVTTSEINVFDPATGKPTRKKAVVSESSLIAAEREGQLYAFSTKEGALYRIDKQSGAIERLSGERIDLGADDVPTGLEITTDRVTVFSSQNVVAYGLDGSLLFHTHHPAPRRSGLLRALLWANAVRAGMASASTGMMGAAFDQAADQQPSDSGERVIARGFADGYGELSRGYEDLSRNYARMAQARFKASAESQDFVFMMVQYTKKDYGLARVSKRTGKILDIVNMERDRAPSYQVDLIANRIYYRSAANEIVSYRF